MKKIKALPILFTAVLLALLTLCVFGLSGCSQQNEIPTMEPGYEFEVGKYDITYDISSNGSMEVCEDLTINYTGYFITGFIRDIPVNGGAQVRNVKVKKANNNGSYSYVWYDVRVDDVNFMSIDIGDSTYKHNKSESYRITYTYVVSNAIVNSGKLLLNPVGTGWGCDINDVSVTLILPDGYKSATCYSGLSGSTDTMRFYERVNADGRTELSTTTSLLTPGHGITFDINFEKGKVKSFFDFTPYIFAIIAAVFLAVIIIIKILIVNKNCVVPVVNYSAPDGMDPMKMGKLIDNKVNSEDVTSMIYYWAYKGYLKINLDNKRNPVIIKVANALPKGTPDYEQTLYKGLFSYGDAVFASTLEGRFYTTVRAATMQLNAQTKWLYSKKSQVAACVFAIIIALLLGLAPLILGLMQISPYLLYIVSLPIAIIPSVIIFAMSTWLSYNRLKLSKAKFAGFTLLTCLIGLIGSVIYVFLVCPGVIDLATKIVLCIVCFGSVGCSALVFNRTKEYTKALNDILGFKNFIKLAEKNQLETMLEQDPQFYYHILPYAQVLGVSDIWEEKFASITIEPPQWMAGNLTKTVLEFHILNSIIRSSTGNMSRNMVSRPAQSGGNGGGHSFGGFGGSSGGGFGGGGGRGR